jgi:ABC-type nickel/cobalt efflux system permease component RcnA
MRSALLTFVVASITLAAHPMGNFSVNHYSRLFVRGGGVEVTYVLDLAEIPTFELLGQWQVDWKDQARLTEESRRQAREWLGNLVLLQAGRRLPLRLTSVSATPTEGAGGMPTLRIRMAASATAEPGEVAYEDRNYPGRAGWKEIVVGQSAADLSGGLTHYPADPAISPPQDLAARISWHPVAATRAPVDTPVPEARPQPSFSQQQPVAPGTVVRGDYLSRLLRQRDIGWGLTLLGIFAAIGLGAMHALSPGHGKTIVAAYLVGSKGTLKHAGLLGFVVTFTHTFTVFLLGLGVLFFQQYVIPEKIVPALGMISGLSIVAVGALLLYRRAKALLDGGHAHVHHHHEHPHVHAAVPELVAAGHNHDHGAPHHHEHSHAEEHELVAAGHGHNHAHANGHVHNHGHDHNRDHGEAHHHEHSHAEVHELVAAGHGHNHVHPHVHSHGGHAHSHMVEGKVTLGSLIALGVSGGLVPCPSALILMLSAIALGRPGLGLLLLVGFSTGLAAVLMGMGFLVIYARHLLPASQDAMKRPLFRLIPVFSAVVVIVLGLAMTAVSAGWVQPLRFL